MDLDECKKNGSIKKTIINKELVKSLIDISDRKEITVKRSLIDEISASSFVSLAYDSLREIMEAICIINGYKVLSHVCLGELLKELDKEFDFDSFDRFRYIRNGINYYGTYVEANQGKEIIKGIFEMKKGLKKRLLSSF